MLAVAMYVPDRSKVIDVKGCLCASIFKTGSSLTFGVHIATVPLLCPVAITALVGFWESMGRRPILELNWAIIWPTLTSNQVK